jgi:anti-sigma regulatory factor (Ser/Thr protein kinase)
MSESIRVRIDEQSQIGEARRLARGAANGIGFDEARAEQVAIVVTEACTNLLKHAGGGEILIRSTTDDTNTEPDLEILALDKGPGMLNLDQCLRDGYSTAGSQGEGLGAITRLSTSTDFYSERGQGAALLARWSIAGRSTATGLQVGAVNVCKPGQEVCGDSWGVEQTEDDSTFMVADGLGHGIEAKIASMEAVRMLHVTPNLAPGLLVERAHQALRSTRGAAVAVTRIDRIANTVTFCGIGNITAQIHSGGMACQSMVSVYGTAGFQTQRIREFTYSWPENGILLMFSDGLGSQTNFTAHPGLALRDPTLIAGVLYRDFSRGNDDVTAVVAKAA